ncbi:hypothetical protein Daura_05970 [Dactylosporangium aurantiacum]|uniref:Uncharacterized protein n=1 Tax=Dactylosporangium aurantiacum TaxID=35754 RepID=A0A9Q9IKY3_9ACTN|nr:hypothetical protein [Dactylosporangium aurantiacum]MDG6108847.1 hypothetical protein [Dactylosporangium aurantiacum]UWZ55747.1 hypothetical protein Daura_05970 [Dactylosporangium aurantiacum]
MDLAAGVLDGNGALLVIAAAIGCTLVGVLAWESRALLLTPQGWALLPIVVAAWFGGAAVLGLPADVLLGHSRAGAIWPGLVAAPVVALVLGHRFRTPGGNSAGRALIRAGVLLAGCTLAKCAAYAIGFRVFHFWTGGAVTLGALVVCVAVWQFAAVEGFVHLYVRAGVTLAAVALVGAWAAANDVPVAGDPGTASTTTVAIMLLVLPLLILAAAVLTLAVLRQVRPDLLRGAPRTATRERAVRVPAAHEVWNAFVAFEDDEEEGKDRPVLVIGADGDTAEVLQITSQDRSRDDGYLPLPLERCRGVLSKESWLRLRPTRVPLERFRGYRGLCPPWIWAELRTRGLITPAPVRPAVKQRQAPRSFIDRLRDR